MDLRDQLQETLGTAYKVERELTAGGMSRVFLATDVALRRQVVVKVLPPDLAAGVSGERFKREILLTANLQHPHIVAVLSAGETGGLPFFMMPYVDGESLRQRLARTGPLPVPEAMHLLRDVALGLAFAHERGVVHRDIKPENVLLSGGSAVVADFGVSKALSDATNPGSDGLTSRSVALGTPAYMAPEQVTADPAADYRADIYSFGCLAYETLTGHLPFAARSPQALLAAQVTATPEPIERHREMLPDGLAALVMRCLAKQPADRPQSANEILRELDSVQVSGERTASTATSGRPPSAERATTRVVGAGIAIAAFALLGFAAVVRLRSRAPGESRAIAVLPFENASADSAQEYFSDGMTDEVASALASGSDMRVAARTSSYSFKRKHFTPQEVGARLGVASIVQGSVRQFGDRLHVTVELVSTKDGLSQWSQTFDRQTKDVYAVQGEITSAVVGALRTRLREGAVSPGHRETANPVAHDLYLRGRYLANAQTRDGLLKGLELFHQASAVDSNYALPYVGIAWAYGSLADAFVPPDSAYPQAEAAAKRALALDSTIAEAWSEEALIEWAYHWNFPGAKRDIDRAHALNPSEPLAYFSEDYYWLAMRQPARAVQAIGTALALDPMSPAFIGAAGQTSFYANAFDSLEAQYRRAREFAPNVADGLGNLIGIGYAWRGMNAKAESTFASLEARHPEQAGRNLARGVLYARTGRRSEAAAIVQKIASEWSKSYAPPELIAAGYAMLGDRDAMYAWLERGVAMHSAFAPQEAVMQPFAPYLREPRFKALLKRIGVPD